MRWYRLLLSLLLLSTLFDLVNSEYWFQFGARAGNSAEFNNGSTVSIQTITPQNVSTGSLAFWVGETLQNNAFIQVGYLLETVSGSYPTYCTLLLGCTTYENINPGQVEWFYEYFPPGYNGGQFLGAVGPAGSAGANGTFNTYGFVANKTNWNMLFNGKSVGSINLGTSTSGVHTPVAFGELANASNANSTIRNVIFSNLTSYQSGRFLPLPSATSFIGYGSGSRHDLKVPYGVADLNNRINYFAVGSGLPLPQNGTQLWNLGYYLNTSSQYGGIASNQKYTAYSKVQIGSPRVVYLGNNTRAMFTSWAGTGLGSYTGYSNNTVILMNGNITERANWQIQYFVNITSAYSSASGTGWYNANSMAGYNVSPTIFYVNNTYRLAFKGWNNGNPKSNGIVQVTAPLAINATWSKQYFLNATTSYGSTTGSGWYQSNSSATASVSPTIISMSNTTRLAFYSWSNGNQNRTILINITSPVSINAIFKREYLATVVALDGYGTRVAAPYFYTNNNIVNSTTFLFAGQQYRVSAVYYKGTWIPLNSTISVNSSSSLYINVPIYNVDILTTDIFGIPLNASASLTFQNGTSATQYSGGNGVIHVSDVPNGKTTGVISFLWFNNQISTNNGRTLRVVFISQTDIIVFAISITITVIIYTITAKRLKTKHERLTMVAAASQDNS